MGFLGGSAVKNLFAMQEPQETWFQSLGQEDSPGGGRGKPLDIFAWRIHRQRSLVGYSPQGRKDSDRTETTEHPRTQYKCNVTP